MTFQLIISRNRKDQQFIKWRKNKIILKAYMKIIIIMNSSFFMLIDFDMFFFKGFIGL